MDIEGAPAEAAGTEPPATGASRRSLAKRLFGLGLGGAAVAALVPQIAGLAGASTPPGTGEVTPEATTGNGAPTSTTATQAGAGNVSPISSPDSGGAASSSTSTSTTTAPKRPTEDDLPLLDFVQSVEIAAYELYNKALALTLSDDERTVLEVIGQSHLAYAQALSGMLGRDAGNDVDEDLVSERSAAFSGAVDTMLQAAYDLESALVATNESTIAQLAGTDAVYLLASIATVEARNGTVLADLMGSTDLSVLLVDNEADALGAGEGMTRVFNDDASISRRGALRLGGLTVAMAAIVAACDNTDAGQLGRVGLAPSTTKLPAETVTDTTLLRTCSSLQYSLLDVYTTVVDDPELLDPVNQPLVRRLIADAQSTAKIFEDLTVAQGGEAWSCVNTKFGSALIDPSMARITVGKPATAEAKEVPPSDDKQRDVLNLVQGMESIITSTYQQYTSMFNDSELRLPTITAAVRGARHAALLALTINPGGYVSASDQNQAEVSTDTTPDTGPSTTAQNVGNTTTTEAASTTAAAGGAPAPTEIPDVYALPWTFGSTATVTIIIGAGDENGTRLKVLLETPSLNSMEYESYGPCPA